MTDRAGPRRPRRPRRAGRRVRRARARTRRRAGAAAVHERDGGGQLLPRGRRGGAVGDPDDRRDRRPARGTPRRRARRRRSTRSICTAGTSGGPATPASPTTANAASGARSPATRGLHAAHGPVQLNLPFREPLIGAAGELPPVGRVRCGRRLDGSSRPPRIRCRRVHVERGRDPRRRAQRRRCRSMVAALHERTGGRSSPTRSPACATSPAPWPSADAILRSESFVAAHAPR